MSIAVLFTKAKICKQSKYPSIDEWIKKWCCIYTMEYYLCIKKNEICVLIFQYFILFISRQRVRKGEREGEKHQYVVASHAPPTGDLACNPGMCPDCQLNQRLFGLQAGTQSTEPHQPGLKNVILPFSTA